MQLLPRHSLIVLAIGLLSATSFAADHAKPRPDTAVQVLQPLSPGLTLPIELTHALKAGHTKPGAPVHGFTTQRIPLSPTTYLPRAAEVTGTVLTSIAPDKKTGRAAVLTIRFDSLRYHQQVVPLLAEALAIANFTEVEDTFASTNDGSDKGNSSSANWTTTQVGGDQVCRSDWTGPVLSSSTQPVGFADFHGVYADPPPGASGPAAIPRAVGVFSTTAHGLYGFDFADKLSSSGGDITVTANGNLVLRTGDDLLLKALPTP
jgi:hypothetical protein